MKLSNCALGSIVGVFSTVSVSVLGQGLPSGVTPEMLDQLKSMSPAQQQALKAKQYGITPTGGGLSTDVPMLAAPGAVLPNCRWN